MKTTIKLAIIGAVLSVSAANVLANPRCGNQGQPPCDLPEPSTPLLFVGAVAVAAAAAKFRKK